MIALTHEPIDTTALLAQVTSPLAGAVVLFLGTVREMTEDRRTNALNYDCYPEMAEKKLAELEAEGAATLAIGRMRDRTPPGSLELTEASVAVAVSSPHRADAFMAGQWLIDTLKETVPIWKQELWADGGAEWVHPR